MFEIIFEILKVPAKEISKWLSRITNNKVEIPENNIQNIIDISIAVFIIFLFILCLYMIISFISKIIKRQIEKRNKREKYIDDNIPLELISYKIERLKNNTYINTRIQTEDPSMYEEPSSALSNTISSDFITHFIEKVFKKENIEGRLYCVLAGTGMGKTTALVNIFISYIKKYGNIDSMPFKIRIFSLTDGEVLNSISNVKDQCNTILLLDALDENVEAVSNLNNFMESLEYTCKNFRFVVVSCRTQFFPDEYSQLKESKLIKDGKYKGYAAYTTFYISPFNENEIEKYIKKVFNVFNYKKRKKALSIFKNKEYSNLLVRPMILSYIKELVNDNNQYTKVIEIYDGIVNYWLEREVGRFDVSNREKYKELLRKLSIKLAENIYLNREARKGYYISKNDFDGFIEVNDVDTNIIKFRERSLINRDSFGFIKFSHKSFLEYFIAYLCVVGDMYIIDYTGIDLTLKMYHELCERYLKKENKLEQIKISTYEDNKTKIAITKLKNIKMRWLDYLCPSHVSTMSKLIKNILIEDDLLWYKTVQILDIYINETDHEYLKYIYKFMNLQKIIIHGDIGMKKNKFIDKLKQIISGVTLIYNNNIILLNGENVLENSKLHYEYKFHKIMLNEINDRRLLNIYSRRILDNN